MQRTRSLDETILNVVWKLLESDKKEKSLSTGTN